MKFPYVRFTYFVPIGLFLLADLTSDASLPMSIKYQGDTQGKFHDRLSAIDGTLGMGGWLGLTLHGLSP